MKYNPELPPFLRLPPGLRGKIYSYLLPPHPEENVTTINYDLTWPYLDHPSSTTFTPHQLDHCRCPPGQDSGSRSAIEEHIYTRYTCQGPNIRFCSKGEPLWILQQSGPAFNILRPASLEELQRRPEAGIIRVNKLIYTETISLLYRGRNFLLLTGICSRGRYQAHATHEWMSRLAPLARSHITSLSLLCQSNEEDCRDMNALKSYSTLARFILEELPRYRSLCLNVWLNQLPLYPFAMLFRRDGTRIFLQHHGNSTEFHVFADAAQYLQHCGGEKGSEWLKLYWKFDGEKVDMDKALHDSPDVRQ